MRKSTRRSLAIAGVAMLTASTFAIAGPVSAGVYGGSLNCPASTKVVGYGFKGNSNYMKITAASRVNYWTGYGSGYWDNLVGYYSTGTWRVEWPGATAGYGVCGTY